MQFKDSFSVEILMDNTLALFTLDNFISNLQHTIEEFLDSAQFLLKALFTDELFCFDLVLKIKKK